LLKNSCKEEILRVLKDKWDLRTNGNCVFVSATEKQNLDALRDLILERVREMYAIRYPYKTMLY